ncbi:MAG: AMP-binding protein [Micropruina sp.]|uniref:class I adenylate-forming enzyme family protein n=1 Tax=Micropruina sp. TaxID=2737536 RepID=UPI0039E5DD4E
MIAVRRSLSKIVADRAVTEPDAVVVVDEDRALTARQLDNAANGLAHLLVRSGVRPDDLVAVTLPNGTDFVIACVAIWRAGATPLPISRSLTDVERAAAEQLAKPRLAIGAPPQVHGIDWLAEVAADADRRPLPDRVASAWKASATSGPTGQVRVVRASTPAVLDPSGPAAPYLPRTAVQLVGGSLTHPTTFDCAFRGLLTGHRLVIQRRFDERRWLDAVETHAITWSLLVPPMMHRLLNLPAAERGSDRLAGLRTILHVGAGCAPDLKRAFLEWAGPERVVEIYAGTQSTGLTMIRGDEWLAHPGSVGRPIEGTEIQIRTPHGLAVQGQSGTVWMRRGVRDPAGWSTLGDAGWVDEHGYLHLIDRIDDVINRGGQKIHPIEVERILESHPSVRSAVAFGLPDDEWGQRVAAVVDIAGSALSPAELRAWAVDRLGPRAPAVVRLVHRPVRNDAGKTARREWARRFGAIARGRRSG